MALDRLDVFLGDRLVGSISSLGGDRSVFSFDDSYADDPVRPALSLSFRNDRGELRRDQRSTQTRLAPFFSNLLPEGFLRTYLAERAGVNAGREFPLLWALGADLPGGIIVRAADGRVLPVSDEGVVPEGGEPALRFSLAGVQLKFSAIEGATGGLTIPATGAGGSWIVKLPSARFAGVAENEFAMMTLAGMVGIEVPPIRLLNVEEIGGLPAGVGRLAGKAYAVQRFDRVPGGGRVHMEDFAQVLGVYPEVKYRQASYRLLAKILWLETGEAGLTEFIRRLVFSALIGNADMHLKNWSLLYRDGVTPTLSPAYDFVSTLAYIPDDEAALTFARTKRWDGFGVDELRYLAARAGVPEAIVVRTARETVEVFREVWGRQPMPTEIEAVIERQLNVLPLARA
ncbi:MAG TPA: kinase [Acetobacteraceae bacterium]|jgi:serine/threonine-protein kinase HipA|nr:kinase [Acetobacteraceae bacterium]